MIKVEIFSKERQITWEKQFEKIENAIDEVNQYLYIDPSVFWSEVKHFSRVGIPAHAVEHVVIYDEATDVMKEAVKEFATENYAKSNIGGSSGN